MSAQKTPQSTTSLQFQHLKVIILRSVAVQYCCEFMRNHVSLGFSPIATTQVLQQMLPAQGSLHIMAPVGHVLDEVISLSSVVASLTAQVEAGKHHS